MARYNGWANYETWAVNLHLSNDQGLYGLAMLFESADKLQEWLVGPVYNLCQGQIVGPLLAMMYQDLLTSSLQSVDWYAVYDALHGEDD